jgi:hypothetical protein
MSKTIRITYYGMDGEGPTVREAKADAGKKLERLVRDVESGPQIYCFGRRTAIIARTRYSWSYRLIENNKPMGGGCTGFENFADAQRSALSHMADLAWSHDVSDDRAFAAEAIKYLEATNHERECAIEDLVYRWQWQRRWKAARDQGFDDNEARNIAGGLMHLVDDYEARKAAAQLKRPPGAAAHKVRSVS